MAEGLEDVEELSVAALHSWLCVLKDMYAFFSYPSPHIFLICYHQALQLLPLMMMYCFCCLWFSAAGPALSICSKEPSVLPVAMRQTIDSKLAPKASSSPPF